MQVSPTQDSLSAAAGAQPDSLGDSVSVIQEIAESVGETGALLATGNWEKVRGLIVEDSTALLVDFVPKLAAAAFVGAVFYGMYRILYRLAENLMVRSPHVDAGLQNLGLKTFQVLGLGLVAVMVLAQLGVNVTALVAGFGITGLALGFAAKDTLENFISGVTILLDRPFVVDDVIRIEEVYGSVEEISLRSTRVRTLGQRTLVMPNTLMINQKLINYSRAGLLRVDVDFGIAYKEDIEETRRTVLPTVDGDDRIAMDPAPDVVVTSLGESSVDLRLRFFVTDANLEFPLRFEYLEKIRKALGEADIEIPFPHLQLHIDEAEAFERSPLKLHLSGNAGPIGEQR